MYTSISEFQEWVEKGWTRKVDSPQDDMRELDVMHANVEKIEARRGKRAWETKNAVHHSV